MQKKKGFASTDGILEILKGTWERVSAKLGDWSPRIVRVSDSRLVDERVPPLHGSKKINKDPPIKQPPAPGNPAWFNLKEPLKKLGGTIRSGLRSTKRLGSKHSSFFNCIPRLHMYIYIFLQPSSPVE
jgi:hypothetical protein